MKNKLLVLSLVFGLVFTASIAFAKNDNSNTKPQGFTFRDPDFTAQLKLVEKDSTNWNAGAVEGGAWGRLNYNPEGDEFNFVFNGHKLESESEYTLIYYPDPWPGNGLICLGNGTANKGGNVHIMGSYDTGDLPTIYDWNHPDSPYDTGDYGTLRKPGAKIWLVLSSDVDCDNQKMIGWQPDEYLFEEEVITFNDINWELLKLENKNTDWSIKDGDGVYGLLSYNTEDTNRGFVFLGYGLQNVSYSLISYKEAHGVGSYIHGTSTADTAGNIRIEGDLQNLVINDYPANTPGDYKDISGAKIWLVPSNYLTSSTVGTTNVNWLSGWQPSFLFETELIFTEPLSTP